MKLISKAGKYNHKHQANQMEELSLRDKAEVALMEQHWNETLTDEEWLQICNNWAGRIEPESGWARQDRCNKEREQERI